MSAQARAPLATASRTGWLFSRPLRPAVMLAAGSSLVLNLTLLVPALFTLQVFERVFTSRSVETLVMLSALVVIALALAWTMDLIRARALETAGAALELLADEHGCRSAECVRVQLDGGAAELSLNDAPATDYQQYVFTLTATAATTALSFTFMHATAFYYLGDVSVAAPGTGELPEPSSLALAAASSPAWGLQRARVAACDRKAGAQEGAALQPPSSQRSPCPSSAGAPAQRRSASPTSRALTCPHVPPVRGTNTVVRTARAVSPATRAAGRQGDLIDRITIAGHQGRLLSTTPHNTSSAPPRW